MRDKDEWISGMIIPVFLFLWVMALPATALTAALPGTIEKIKPGIVGVGTYQVTRTPPAALLGTGFAVLDGRYVVTNLHVVSMRRQDGGDAHLAIFLGSGVDPEVRMADKIAVDQAHDLVLLRIHGRPLAGLALGDSSKVREGELYAFTGFPIGAVLGLFPVTHRGIVSAITPIIAPLDYAGQLKPDLIRQLQAPFDVFQLDATAYPGNSGSPLYDPGTGEVVAVVNMVLVKGKKESMLSEPSGISYAIPVAYVHSLLRKAGLAEP